MVIEGPQFLNLARIFSFKNVAISGETISIHNFIALSRKRCSKETLIKIIAVFYKKRVTKKPQFLNLACIFLLKNVAISGEAIKIHNYIALNRKRSLKETVIMTNAVFYKKLFLKGPNY